ncbi:MAG: acylphosphatase [Methanophagales archaeon]|nr:acylphosphatase [Methanophagales archaeon]
MKRRLVIKGDVVHDIGFRLFLYEQAEVLDIAEFQARNVERAVEVLVGGDEAEVAKFVEFVEQERPERADVEDIETEEYEGKIKPIDRFAQSFMLAQMGKFVNIGMEMLATEKAIKKDTGKMLEKQDSLLEKQDETLSEVKGLREDLKSYMEERFERIEHEISVIKEKIGVF